jgi:FHA domain/Protein of unknown function (DUF3662)
MSHRPLIIDAPTKAPRLPARDIVDAVVRNMRENLEELPYSRLAPSSYTVYLHPAEFARLEAIVSILQEQTVRALSDEINNLSRRSLWRRSADRVIRSSQRAIQTAGGDWKVTFLPDPDEELEEGGVLVYSELKLPARPELGGGERTRRITTIHVGQHTTVREQTIDVPAQASGKRTVARVEYTDDAGPHAHDIVTDSVMIGRGGIACPVDIRIASSPDVSREHARIRRDSKTGVFYVIDLSSFGTTLNGRHLPRGYEKVDGTTKRENGSETALPDAARIGLADMVFLEFRKVP